MARAMGRPSSTVGSWGARNSIPDAEKPLVLAAAQARGIDLRPEHFFPAPPPPGADEPPPEASPGAPGPILADRAFGADGLPLEARPGAPYPNQEDAA
jgi:hypothetical protein